MKYLCLQRLVVSGLAFSGICTVACGDLLGQVDTFNSGTMGWQGGANTAHVSSNGAGGSGDGYLQLSRPVENPFHIASYNTAQWAGNYLAAGITAIQADLKQVAGPDALKIRLVIWGPGGIWASQDLSPITSEWGQYTFELDAGHMVSVDNTGTLSDTLQSVTRIQLRHDYPTPTAPGGHPEHVAATLGIDNVAAIPEPGTLGYMLVAGGAVALARMRRQRASVGRG